MPESQDLVPHTLDVAARSTPESFKSSLIFMYAGVISVVLA